MLSAGIIELSGEQMYQNSMPILHKRKYTTCVKHHNDARLSSSHNTSAVYRGGSTILTVLSILNKFMLKWQISRTNEYAANVGYLLIWFLCVVGTMTLQSSFTS